MSNLNRTSDTAQIDMNCESNKLSFLFVLLNLLNPMPITQTLSVAFQNCKVWKQFVYNCICSHLAYKRINIIWNTLRSSVINGKVFGNKPTL